MTLHRVELITYKMWRKLKLFDVEYSYIYVGLWKPVLI